MCLPLEILAGLQYFRDRVEGFARFMILFIVRNLRNYQATVGRLCAVHELCVVVFTSAAATADGGKQAGGDTVTGCNTATWMTLSGPPPGCSVPELAPELAAETISGASTALGSVAVIL